MDQVEFLKKEEGEGPIPYTNRGLLYIGYGHRCSTDSNPTAFSAACFDSTEKLELGLNRGRNFYDEPMSPEEQEYLLHRDISKAEKSLTRVLSRAALDRLPQEAVDILVRMVFQMGTGGVRGFVSMRKALEKNPPDFQWAAAEMRDSLWHNSKTRGTPERAEKEAKLMEALA